MRRLNSSRLSPYFRYFGLVAFTCFAIEILTTVTFEGFDFLSPIQFAVLNASILSITLLAGLYFWIFPHLEREQEATLGQAQLL